MKIDPVRVEKIVSSFIDKSFFYNTIIDLTDDYCITFASADRFVERTFSEFVDVARSLTHPLFKNKLETDLNIENLKLAYKNRRTIRVEVLIQDFHEKAEYHWNRLRLIPIDDGTGHVVFFLNLLRVDDDIRRFENNRAELFNKAVIEQLISNYLLIYVIDLSNGMSRLVFSNEGNSYNEYAKGFDSHYDMMMDSCEQYVADDFKVSFARFADYKYVSEQLKEKERLVLVLRDKAGRAYEMTISKFPEYSDDYPVVIFSLKEIV